MNTSPNPEFDALVSGLKESMQDPVVTNLINEVQQFEAILNQKKEGPTSEEVDDALFVMNSILDRHELLDTEIIVSGRLRIESSEYEDYDQDTRDRLKRLYGDLHEDIEGPFFLVDQLALECGQFDIRAGKGENEEYQRLILQMSNEVEDDDYATLYVCVDELDEFMPREPSVSFVIREIRERYPEIALQLDTLPENCEDDALIMESLEDFIVEIDWSRHTTLSDEDRQHLLSFIERYIDHRLKFDIASYEIGIDGPFYKKGVNKMLRQFSSDVIQKRGVINRVILSRLDSPVESQTIDSYAPELEVIAPAPRRGAGNELLIIPVYSVAALRNLRNEFVDNEDEGAEYFQDTGSEYYDDTSEDDSTNEMSELDDHDAAGEVDITEFLVEREKQLEQILEELQALRTKVIEVSQSRFTDEESIVAAQQLLMNSAQLFAEKYRVAATAIEFSGPSVIAVAGKVTTGFDAGTDTVTITLAGTEALEADLFTFKKGLVTNIEPLRETHEDGSTTVSLILKCQSIERINTIEVKNESVPDYGFIRATFESHFAAKLDDGLSISLPEYDQMKNISRQIEQINNRFPDAPELPDLLNKLYMHMKQADPQTFNDFPDISLVRSIGEMVKDNEGLADKTSTALVDIMANAPVFVTGVAYDAHGEMDDDADIVGQIIDIVHEVSFIPEREPMLKVKVVTSVPELQGDDDDESSSLPKEVFYFLPLTSIRSLKI